MSIAPVDGRGRAEPHQRLGARYAARMYIEDISYEVDGTEFIGHLAVDETTDHRRPAVLVCHEGPGLSDNAKQVAERLAVLGHVAFALDYHGGGRALPRDAMYARLGELMGDVDQVRRLANGGLKVLLDQPTADASRVAAIGYCFGGTMALELARSGAAVHATVGFHSGLTTSRPQDASNITGKVLALIGTEDPIIPLEHRNDFEAEMRAGDVDWRMVLYGGAQHSFTNKDAASSGMAGIAYNEAADTRSWRAMIDLFDETFG
jgi:dienelactone hydrolase